MTTTPRGVSYPEELLEEFLGVDPEDLCTQEATKEARGLLADVLAQDHGHPVGDSVPDLAPVASWTRSWIRRAVGPDRNPGYLAPVLYGLLAVGDDFTLIQVVYDLVPRLWD